MVILKRIGIKTIKIHNNGKIYDVFYKREIDGIQDFEFLNNLHEYRRAKQIRDEWSKEPLIDYTPELSNMQNASDELLRQDEVYYTNESKQIKYNMKKNNKKALYESIMTSVAKEVKKVLKNNLSESYYSVDTYGKINGKIEVSDNSFYDTYYRLYDRICDALKECLEMYGEEKLPLSVVGFRDYDFLCIAQDRISFDRDGYYYDIQSIEFVELCDLTDKLYDYCVKHN